MRKFLYRNILSKHLHFNLKLLNKTYLRNKELLQQELLHLPEGTLYIKSTGSYPNCYVKKGTSVKGIHHSENDAKLLARKMQAISEMKETEICIETTNSAINKLDNYFRQQEKSAGHVTLERLPELFDYKTFAINKQNMSLINKYPQVKNWHHKELKYKTRCGEIVRSKSEMIIADTLYEYGVFFLYEPQMKINDFYFVPDFLIKSIRGRIIIWEHLGLLDNPDYKKNSEIKLENYKKNGFKQNSNLIITDESDISSRDSLRDIIEMRIL